MHELNSSRFAGPFARPAFHNYLFVREELDGVAACACMTPKKLPFHPENGK